MAGISDIRHELCLALALWNGNDPILKERMFGLTGPQGNHGEDVKEYWWYLEGLPSHALLKWRYHYPQAAFPYDQLVHHGRGLHDPELELLDTGVFDDDRYWSVDVDVREGVADGTADAHRAREPRPGRGDTAGAADALVPQYVVVWRRIRAASDRRGRGGAHGDRPSPRGLPARRRSRPGWCCTRAALLRERIERTTRLRRRGDDPVPEGRDQRPRRLWCGDGQPRRLRDEGRAPLPRDRRCGRQGRTAAPTPSAGGNARARWRLGRRSVRRRRRRSRARCRRVLRRARARRNAARADADPPAVVCGSRLEQADVSLQRRSLAGRRCARSAAGGAPARTQQRLATPRRIRCARDARPVGVPLVRRLGSRLPRGSLGAFRSSLREVPADRLAARMVSAPQRRAPGLRVEFRRRQPAGARDGGAARVPDRRCHRSRVPRARLPETADQLHLVAQPRGRGRQQRVQRRLSRPRQHQPGRPVEPAAKA